MGAAAGDPQCSRRRPRIVIDAGDGEADGADARSAGSVCDPVADVVGDLLARLQGIDVEAAVVIATGQAIAPACAI